MGRAGRRSWRRGCPSWFQVPARRSTSGTRAQINPTHLTEGRFAPRAVYGTIHGDVEAWLARKSPNDGRLPVWWITGPSGTGKSVALLHLLANLHSADDRRIIIWLDDQMDRLAEAIMGAPVLSCGLDVIFAADDPYTAERAQRVSRSIEDALRELDSIVVAYPLASRPSLICCGPTEQSEYFEKDVGDRVQTERSPPELIQALDESTL